MLLQESIINQHYRYLYWKVEERGERAREKKRERKREKEGEIFSARTLMKITLNFSNLTRYRTIVFFKEEKNLSGWHLIKIVSQQSYISRICF